MKSIAFLFLTIATVSCSVAQTKYEWRATVKTVDEQGLALPRVNIRVGFYTNSEPGVLINTTGTNGLLTVSRLDAPGVVGFPLSFIGEKDGYYSTQNRYDMGVGYDPAKWIFTETLVLKKISKPTAMYARRLNNHVPDIDKAIGFDLEIGDWVSPYGKGIRTDINFTGHFDKFPDGESDFTLTVSFPKDGDGIQEFFVAETEKGNDLRSSHEAPASGYQPRWIQTDKRKPGKPVDSNYDQNRNYYFRVRTAKDNNGNIVSAHYGKIYGDFMQFTYYLNPTPSDRNIEFDPKQNLISNLPSFQRVDAP